MIRELHTARVIIGATRRGFMAVILSSSAAARVSQFMSETPGTLGLRFGVKKSGCSGWAYVVDMTSERKDGDSVFESHGVQVFVDAQSLAEVDGTEIDFIQTGLNHHFVFRNPRVTGECGCGESFTTAPEAEMH
jgi:iron-sulfur cluster assembly protein